MKRLIRACSSTIGKKFVIAVTGLLLCGFLVVHLVGNLLLYVGPTAYNDYAHALHENDALLKVGEVGLVALFLTHLMLAIRISFENRAARKVRYRLNESKIENRQSPFHPENFMLISGLFVLGFLVLHLVDFTFLLRTDIAYSNYEGNEAAKADAILSTPLTQIVYAIGCALLGLHLAHGFSSAFQSLGMNHPQYESLLKWIGVIFAVVIAVGFVSFPIVYFLR